MTETTIHNWKKDHPEFFESITRGKHVANFHIAQKLYNRAEGSEWIEQRPFKLKKKYIDDKGNKVEEEEVVTVNVKMAAPPDVQAIKYFLGNRRPDLWRDKVNMEMTGEDGGPIQIENVRDHLQSLLSRAAAGGTETEDS